MDAIQFVWKCDKCQRFFPIQRQPFQELKMVSSFWPFAKWEIDIIGPLSKDRDNASFAIITINYFTKWVETEPLTKITDANTFMFL